MGGSLVDRFNSLILIAYLPPGALKQPSTKFWNPYSEAQIKRLKFLPVVWKFQRFTGMNPNSDKVVRRITMVATVTASYLLLTADYGPEPNALDPIKNAILSAQKSAKEFIFGSKKEIKESDTRKMTSAASDKPA